MFHDPAVLNTTCDLVRVMCYDMYFAPGIDKPELKHRDDCMGIGPTSNYLWTREAMLFWMKHIPNDKLVMALPAYANDYAVTGGIKGRQIYQSVPDSINGILPSPIWLCYEKVNMYLYDGTDGNRHLFYASDARSTEALLELADELGISVETVRNYFGGHNFKDGKSCGIHIEPGPDGGLVVLDDTTIFERALQILAENEEVSEAQQA